jgi:protein TonB
MFKKIYLSAGVTALCITSLAVQAASDVDLTQEIREIVRQEAQLNRNNAYSHKSPPRKLIGERTLDYQLAQYVEDWRIKLERIGNLNYPEQALRDQIYGKVQLSVSIKADGSVMNIRVNRSSGQRVLDDAAVRIIKLAAPFAPLPPDISKDTILTITRTWFFDPSNKLKSE